MSNKVNFEAVAAAVAEWGSHNGRDILATYEGACNTFYVVMNGFFSPQSAALLEQMIGQHGERVSMFSIGATMHDGGPALHLSILF